VATTNAVNVCAAGGESKIIEINAADDRYALIVNLPFTITFQQRSQLANIRTTQHELYLTSSIQIRSQRSFFNDVEQASSLNSRRFDLRCGCLHLRGLNSC
jgi:hypothetical protein